MSETKRETTCRACGAANSAIANYCRQCGIALSERLVQPVTTPTALTRQWRSLTLLMTRKGVRKLLGEPVAVRFVSTPEDLSAEQWTYQYKAAENSCQGSVQDSNEEDSPNVVSATVTFDSPDGRILSWVEPDWTKL